MLSNLKKLGVCDMMNCLRCNEELKFLKEFKFESEEVNRGFFKSFFDLEEPVYINSV